MKQRTVHMVGNAHIDAVWLWQWQEAFQEVKATFRSALDRLRETDDFVFTSSSAAYYWRLEGHDPAMFAEIRQRVAEGRWVICGGWWVQPDCNIPNGESFVRHGLYAQRYLREKLGTVSRVGYSPDAFGHSAMLPQILRKQGMEAYVFHRPEPHEKALPGPTFAWEADDGSRVLAFRIPFGYSTGSGDLERVVRRVLPELRDPFDELMCFYGVGNHGGGPTIANLESIRAMDADPEFPRLVMSSPPRFFAAMRAKGIDFPVVHDELQHHARGCYSAHSGVKRWNRRAEHLLMAAEAWATIADAVAQQPYPDVFPRAWRSVLFNQFHDILAGSSIEAAYDDARDLYGEAASLAHRALNNAIQAISWRIAIPNDDPEAESRPRWNSGHVPVVVFNPHAWPARVPVEFEAASTGPVEGLADDEGTRLPVQEVHLPAAIGDSRRRLAFVADLPPLGYRVYHLRMTPRDPGPFPPPGRPPGAEAEPPPAPVRRQPSRDDTVMENSALRVELEPESGCLTSLYDRAVDFEVLRGDAARAVVVHDPTDTWGHGMTALDDEVGAFRPTSVRRIESGPVRSTIRVESEWERSSLRQDFTLYASLPLLFVEATLDWQERHAALKLRFPVDLLVPRATYEIPYGHVERPNDGAEQPGQRWLDLTGLRPDRRVLYGLALLNDAKHGFDVRPQRFRNELQYAEIGMTVVRSPIYAHHDPYRPPQDHEYAYMDLGLQRFRYALQPHPGSWELAGTVRRAVELNQAPFVIVETFHDGPLAQRASFAGAEPENVLITVVKRAEDDDDVVLRACETAGQATTATIRLPAWGRVIETRFGPCEIKTLKVPRDAGRPVVETDLIEWGGPEGAAS